MTEKPLVSVLMTTHNRIDYLPFSIESVLKQTYAHLELIIVDDGSTDDTVSYIKTLTDPRIRLIELPENRHLSTATNRGLKECTGEFLAYMDDDDTWEPEKLEKQLAAFAAHPEAGVCFTWVNLINEKGESLHGNLDWLRDLYASRIESQDEWLRTFFFFGSRVSKPSSLTRMEVARKIGLHDLAHVQLHDFEWWVRAAKLTNFIVLEEELTNMRRFEDQNENCSGQTIEKDSRMINETMHIRSRFFDGMNEETFIRVFGGYFVKPDAKTPEELACEKAFLLEKCELLGEVYPYYGLAALAELLNQEETRRVLEETYHFTTLDYYKHNTALVFAPNHQLAKLKADLETASGKAWTLSQELEAAKISLGDEIFKNSQISQELQNLKSEFESLWYDRAAKEDHVNDLLKLHSENQAAIQTANSECARLQAELAAMTAEKEALRAEKDALRAEKDALSAEKDALRAELEGIYSSKSWKMTHLFGKQ